MLAFVLINCDLGSENLMIEQLHNLKDVKEVHGTFGPYDIIAKVESENSTNLRDTITNHIRTLEHIRSTLTLTETGKFEKQAEMPDLIPDVIPEERKPLEPPEEMDEDYDEDEDDYDEDEDDYSQKDKKDFSQSTK